MAVALRPMTEAEYAPYMSRLRANYARERAEVSGTPPEEERVASDRQLDGMLPDGMRTPRHHFWNVVAGDGVVVGVLWVEYSGPRAFIYDIETREEQRGKGYGAATLAALEAELRPRGVARIALSVFAENDVARRLYERSGYHAVALQMQRDL